MMMNGVDLVTLMKIALTIWIARSGLMRIDNKREAATNRRLFSCKNKHLRRLHLKRVLSNQINDLQTPGREPHFVNENNALRATVKPSKCNDFNHLVMSIENLRGILNVMRMASARQRQ
jgi:hypothetical protein